MFTGIITYTGRFEEFTKERFSFKIPKELRMKIYKGASIAVDGVCLTVKNIKNSIVSVDVMDETLKKTTLGNLHSNALVNLELPVTPDSLISGHIVQGHIDGVAKLDNVVWEGNSRILKFIISSTLNKYIVEKGSIAVNGIALTVIEAGAEYFTVGIIPYTWDNTMLRALKLGDFVNIEVDILAKYIERLLKK